MGLGDGVSGRALGRSFEGRFWWSRGDPGLLDGRTLWKKLGWNLASDARRR